MAGVPSGRCAQWQVYPVAGKEWYQEICRVVPHNDNKGGKDFSVRGYKLSSCSIDTRNVEILAIPAATGLNLHFWVLPFSTNTSPSTIIVAAETYRILRMYFS